MPDNVNSVREGIVGEIRRAFGHVSRGDGVTLHEATVIDDYGSDEERAVARALDPDLDWQDVPDHLIEEHQETLCFVDVKGFCYYLPAYMVWALRHYDGNSNSFSLDHSIYSLMSSEHKELREWQSERFSAFKDQQAKAICRFLRFMALQEDFVDTKAAREAIDAYWGRFCEAAR
jgi:hypothetical protein